jgi:ubiquinone/menaquinone biosynthesis C-methylase UbiE
MSLAGGAVLEVGSGRGGGASYLARYQRPKTMTGVDFSPQAVAWSQQRHTAVPHLQFIVGDAERLPFPDASFDAVINVESSHCYGHIEKFFSEVARVLKPGGCFLYTDFRPAAGMKTLEETLAAETRWAQLAREDITAGVVAALEADHARKQALIRERVPVRFQPLFGEFAGLVGGQMHTRFRERTILYHRFAFRRL